MAASNSSSNPEGVASPAPPAGFRTLKEGSVSILYEYNESQDAEKAATEPVFYNKVQVLNRDLSIKMITLFARQRARELASAPKGNRAARRHAKFAAKQQAASAAAGASTTAPESAAGSEGSGTTPASGGASDCVLEMTTTELDAKLREEAPTKGITILDALAATGLRSIRYFKEIPGVKQVVTNDLDPAAVAAAKQNVLFNGLTLDQVTPHQGDANRAMLFPQHLTQQPAPAAAATAAGDGDAAADSSSQPPPPPPAPTPAPPPAYDVIDLDPYGTAAPFVDSAVQAVADGGLLCVTCTDMASLSGNQPEACFAKYGSMPTRGKYLHEMALRILLHSLEESACRYRRHIAPVLCVGIDFYIRVFVRVFESPAEVKRTCLKRGYVFQSVRCPTFFLQPVAKQNNHSFIGALGPPMGLGACPDSGGAFRIGGPMWTEPLHDMAWVREALADVTAYKDNLGPAAAAAAAGSSSKGGGKGKQKKGGGGDGGGGGGGGGNGNEAASPSNCGYQGPPLPFPPTQTYERLHGLLTSVSEELPDVPLYYTLPSLCETLHCTSPKMDDFKSALINAGYRVSAFHKESNAVKTDAPPEVVWDIMRCWVKKHPVSAKRAGAENSPGSVILEKEPTLQADFSRPKTVSLVKSKAQRFPKNPEDFWGPKSRAKGKRPPHSEGAVSHEPTTGASAPAGTVAEGAAEPAPDASGDGGSGGGVGSAPPSTGEGEPNAKLPRLS